MDSNTGSRRATLPPGKHYMGDNTAMLDSEDLLSLNDILDQLTMIADEGETLVDAMNIKLSPLLSTGDTEPGIVSNKLETISGVGQRLYIIARQLRTNNYQLSNLTRRVDL